MELQRLSLLVDKVLKLSMFENKQITLQKESFNFIHLVEEVLLFMKLQLEKNNVKATLETTGENFVIKGDRLHISSVIYNLLDNALKYSRVIRRYIYICLIKLDTLNCASPTMVLE